MAHTFDSGLEKPQRTLVREQIVTALADLRFAAAEPKYLRAIKHLPATLIGEGAEDFLKRAVNGQMPAVAIAIGERKFNSGGNDNLEWAGAASVHIYIVTAHQRDVVDGRTVADVVALADDTADPGLDVIAEHVFERLAGLPLTDANGGCLRPVSEEPLFVDLDRTVFEQVYAVELQTDVNPNRHLTEVAEDIETEHEEDDAGDLPDLTTLTELDPP